MSDWLILKKIETMYTTTVKLILDYNADGTVMCHIEGDSTNPQEDAKLKHVPGHLSTTFISATTLAFVNIIDGQANRTINLLELFNEQVKKGLEMVESGKIVTQRHTGLKRDN